jgi:hypothetical protein
MGSPQFMAKLVEIEYLSATASGDLAVQAAQCASAIFCAVSISGVMIFRFSNLVKIEVDYKSTT